MSATAARAADRRQVALVAVAERRRRSARAAAPRTSLRRVAALLHRHRRDAGQHGLAVGSRTRTMSPSANTSGWPGSVRSGSTVTRPAPSRLGAGQLGQPAGEADAVHARRPDHRPRAGSAARRSPLRRHAVGVDADHRAAGRARSRRAAPASAARLRRQRRRERRRARGRPPRRAGCAPCAGRSSGSRGAACRARARRSGRPSPRRSARRRRPRTSASAARRPGSGSTSAASNAAQDPAADRRARSRATSPRRRAAASRRGRSTSSASRRRRSACRRGPRPAPARRRPAAAAPRAPRGRSRSTSASSTRTFRLPLEDRPQRIGDLARRQRAGRHLVGERLEEVEVAAVDQRHLDRRAAQLQRRLQPAEAAADDHDTMRDRAHGEQDLRISLSPRDTGGNSLCAGRGRGPRGSI